MSSSYDIIATWRPHESPDVVATSLLATPIQISSSDNYEIAVREIYFTPNFINSPMDNWIHVTWRVDPEDEESNIGEEFIYLPVSTYSSINEVVAALRRGVRELEIRGNRLSVVKEREKQRIRWKIGPGVTVSPSVEMSIFMGFPPNFDMTGPPEADEPISNYISHELNFLKDKQVLFLKSDLIAPNACMKGDSYEPILDICPIYYDSELSYHSFEIPKYKKIKSNYVELIDVRLCDEIGRVMKSIEGVVYVVLHIKRS